MLPPNLTTGIAAGCQDSRGWTFHQLVLLRVMHRTWEETEEGSRALGLEEVSGINGR
jgi:hypothetical protein